MYTCKNILSLVQLSNADQCHLIAVASRLHRRTYRQLVRPLWMSDRPVAGTSTSQQTTLTRDKTSMPPAGFEPAVPATERL